MELDRHVGTSESIRYLGRPVAACLVVRNPARAKLMHFHSGVVGKFPCLFHATAEGDPSRA